MGLQAIIERIQFNPMEQKRVNTLAKVISADERKKIAAKLNQELGTFTTVFIASFIGRMSGSPLNEPLGISKQVKADTTESKKVFTHYQGTWAALTDRWEAEKQKQGLAVPNFFRYNKARLAAKKPRKGDKQGRSKVSLEAALTAAWGHPSSLFGVIKPADILFKSSLDADIAKKGGAFTKLEKPLLAADKNYFPVRKIKGLSGTTVEEISISLKAFSAVPNWEGVNNSRGFADTLTRHMIKSNSAANGFAGSKLMNNSMKHPSRHLRPTLLPLMMWYYKVRLPSVFRKYYSHGSRKIG